MRGLALAVFAAVLVAALHGCGASRPPEVRERRRATTVHVLRSAGYGVDALLPLCPLPLEACGVARKVGVKLADVLHDTANTVAASNPLVRLACATPLVDTFLSAAVAARLQVPGWLVLALSQAVDFAERHLPDCREPEPLE